MKSNDLIKIYAYGTSKNLISAKEKIRCSNIIRRSKND